jgi:hypothetical protein
MSRAFLRDDAEGEMPRRHYHLPDRSDPDYDRACARALLEAAVALGAVLPALVARDVHADDEAVHALDLVPEVRGVARGLVAPLEREAP